MKLTLPLDLPENHQAENIAVACFDWRMAEQFLLFFKIYLRMANYFKLDFPGSAKLINENPNYIIPAFFSTPIEKCGARRIVILDHEDCLAWGGSESFENPEMEKAFHFGQLINARDNLNAVYPMEKLDIKLYYAQFIRDRRGKLLLDFVQVR